ncbi:MAG: nickel pincer cofactor biosynthesis protein LarC [Spirochaetales bacterium]|nr:nickel pincer cofactor biosynthesis protein LarC [Spirochaetales bacterium]
MAGILHFDLISGISGDMTVAALLAAGVDQGALRENLQSLKLEGVEIRVEKVQVNGITATDFSVLVDESHGHRHAHTHRDLTAIEGIIESSGITPGAKQLSRRIFRCLAQAESAIHGRPPEKITFHEVGAVDSIVDIVATAVCIDLLAPERVSASRVPLGHGTTRSAHGVIPVPAPATLEILKEVPVYDSGIQSELVTPTGAAILKTIVSSFGTLPAMRIETTGYGAGKKRFEDRPNLLRVVLGRQADTGPLEKLTVLETNLDDMNPEIYSYLMPLLLERGALDAFLTQVLMKKGRPAVQLSVLCRPGDESALEAVIFRETTTLGVRRHSVLRSRLERQAAEIETELGTLRVKVIYQGGSAVRAVPEYEECRRIAADRGLPLREVYERLQAGLRQHLQDGSFRAAHGESV